eukprot:765408-Hanusia_phi.AAC.1
MTVLCDTGVTVRRRVRSGRAQESAGDRTVPGDRLSPPDPITASPGTVTVTVPAAKVVTQFTVQRLGSLPGVTKRALKWNLDSGKFRVALRTLNSLHRHRLVLTVVPHTVQPTVPGTVPRRRS